MKISKLGIFCPLSGILSPRLWALKLEGARQQYDVQVYALTKTTPKTGKGGSWLASLCFHLQLWCMPRAAVCTTGCDFHSSLTAINVAVSVFHVNFTKLKFH